MTEQELIAAMGGLERPKDWAEGLSIAEMLRQSDTVTIRHLDGTVEVIDQRPAHAPQQHDDGVGCRCGKDWPHA